MKERMKRIIAVMLIGILILVQYTFQAPVTASQPETEQGVTISGETGTESGETKEETKTIVEEISTDTESIVSEGGETDTSREEQIEETTEVVTSEENSEEEYITSEENFGEGTTEVFTSEEVTTEEKTTEGTGIGRAITRTVGGTNTNVPITTDPTQIDPKSYVPYNRLRILSPDKIIDSTKVEISVLEISGYDQKNENEKWVRVDSDSEKNVNAVYHGSWNEAKQYIYSSFQGDYDAISTQFCGSNTNARNDVENHEWYALVGWDIDYFDIATTPMWIKVKYKGSVTYDGKPVICIATLKVTPFKNRTTGYNDNQSSYGSKSYNSNSNELVNYYPTLQISELLYNGWVWQNVKDCQATLEFYYDTGHTDTGNNEDMGTKISLDPTTYNSYIGSYYTINSLNPDGEGDNGNNDGIVDEEDHRYGPEYVLPQGNNNVYVITGSNIDISYTGGEHITTSDKTEDYFVTTDWNNTSLNWFYDNDKDNDGEIDEKIQYAYNGGEGDWDGDENPDTWSLNSVTVMPNNTSQDSLVFTMGQLLRRKHPYSVYHTANMWASITTSSFGIMRELIDITIEKKWQSSDGTVDSSEHDNVNVTLWKTYTKIDGTYYEEEIATQTLSSTSNWQSTFKNIIPESYLKYTFSDVDADSISEANYIIREETPEGYEYTVQKSEDGETQTITENGKTYEVVDLKFTVTNKPVTGKITVSKLGVNDTPLANVTYKLEKKADDGTLTTIGTADTQKTEDTQKAICIFDNLEKGNYILTETKTVSGYNLLKEPIEITIPYETDDITNIDPNVYEGHVAGSDNKHYYYHITYTVINTQYMALPESGGGLRMILQICGVVLIGTSIISYFVYRKKEKGKGDD